MKKVILSAKDIIVDFNLRGKHLKAIRNASLDLYAGETLAIVGESGSGKSVLSKTFVGMLDKNGCVTNGSIVYNGMDLTHFKTEKEWLKIRGKEISMIFQDPMTALNPLKTIGEQIREVISLHKGLTYEEAKREAIQLLNKVGIDQAEIRYKQYPFEFSGGMRQRVVIAISIACNPKILICDEPTTALDVTIQAQILDLLKSLQKEMNMSVIFITHDLGVVANVADRAAVMYGGQIIEYGLVDEIFYQPKHPYTWALLASLPQLGIKGNELYSIPGSPPNLFKEIKGDAFAPRNKQALEIDFCEEPPFFKVSETHYAKTWMLHEYAPTLEKPHILEHVEQSIEDLESTDKANKNKEVLLQVKNLQVDFKLGRTRFSAVKDVSFEVYKGETFSLVGESGSGKTTIGRAIIKIHPTSKGEIIFKDEKINKRLKAKEKFKLHKNIQMIFQDPMASLNERAKIDYIISEGLYNFKLFKSDKERYEKVEKAMKDVGLSPEFATRYPHEFSGGQRQRIGIARSLVMEPELIIADEPISSLDVSIRAQILNLMNQLKKDKNLTYLFIAHDLSVVKYISDRIGVIYKGQLVELASANELFIHPLHPYTKALLSAIPQPNPQYEKEKKLIIYNPKEYHDYSKDKPNWVEITKGHYVLANQEETKRYKALLNG